MKNGGSEDLKRIYGPFVSQPESGYDVTLRLDLDNLPAEKGKRVYRHVLSAHFGQRSFLLSSASSKDIFLRHRLRGCFNLSLKVVVATK